MAARLVEMLPGLWLSRSYTTRAPRPGEPEDAYFFVDRAEFELLVEQGRFLEWAEFLGELYGTPWPDPPAGRDVVLEIDLQGAEQVRSRHRDATVILLLPPSEEIQADRLRGRGEDLATIEARLAIGREEVARGSRIADAVVVNGDVDQAVSQVAGIVEAKRSSEAQAPLAPESDPPRRNPMARRRPTLMDPPVEDLLDKVDSKFTLVALSSKRARQINSYYNQLGDSMGVIVPPQVTSVSGKPLTIAFEEIATSKTTYHRLDSEDARGDADATDLEVVAEVIDGSVEAAAAAEAEQAGPSADGPRAGSSVADSPRADDSVADSSAADSSEGADMPAGDEAPDAG